MKTILIALTIALLFPATAFAQFGRTTGGSGSGRQGNTCQGASSTKIEKVLAKWQPELGGDNTRKAWKKLITAGEPGCDAVVAHLDAGGAGLVAADYADIGRDLVLGGADRHMAVGTALILRGEPEITKNILGAMEARLAHFSPEQAQAVASDSDPAVREAALGPLIGYHSIGALESVMGVPVWKGRPTSRSTSACGSPSTSSGSTPRETPTRRRGRRCWSPSSS